MMLNTPSAVIGTGENACKTRNNEIPSHIRTSFGSRVRHHSHNINSKWENKGFRIRFLSIKASLISDPDAFQVGKLIGSYGFMNVTR